MTIRNPTIAEVLGNARRDMVFQSQKVNLGGGRSKATLKVTSNATDERQVTLLELVIEEDIKYRT